MSTKELYFENALTIGLGPGAAVAVRAGEVLAAPAHLVEILVKRLGVVEAGKEHADARRVSVEERKVAPELARLVSPPLDEDRLLSDFQRQKAAATLRAEIEAMGKRPAKPA